MSRYDGCIHSYDAALLIQSAKKPLRLPERIKYVYSAKRSSYKINLNKFRVHNVRKSPPLIAGETH